MDTMNWSPQQAEALDRVAAWMKNKDKPYFYLAGFAGTGKTTLAKHFAEGVSGEVAYGSFTGKAASVMRSKGCDGATTIHRMIYTPASKSGQKLRVLRDKLERAKSEKDDQLVMTLRIQVMDEVEKMKSPNFDLNADSNIRTASLVIVDEISQINDQMGKDLLSYNIPVLVLGDPAQLPPVRGTGFFTERKPDMMLTEVHRQARESGILRLATEIREGRQIDYCDYGDAEVVRKGDIEPEEVPEYDQVIVGKNKTRHATNIRMRQLLGRTSALPEVGDRLLCLRNNHDLGLLNGEIYYAGTAARPLDETVSMWIVPDGAKVESRGQLIEAWTAPLLGERLEHWGQNKEVQEFGYGYVLTCHKSQGSQFDNVIVFDESSCFRADAARWLYTAVTRAAKRLTVVR